MTTRGRTFGAAAEAYERYRPGYPGALVDRVLAYAAAPVARALEIGAGTGKATRAFVARGISVTASEPDADMLAELQRRVPEALPLLASLEDLQSDSTFDLVFAGMALHWTASPGRWERLAEPLRDGGTFATFGGPIMLADRADQATVEEARGDLVPSEGVPPPDPVADDAAMRWPGGALQESGLFDDVREVDFTRRERLATEDYVGILSTSSAYLMLSPDDRATVLQRIEDALPVTVDVTHDLTLHLARRRPR